MEVPGLGDKSELHLQAFAPAIAMQDLSHICKLHHSLQQHQILNSLSEAGIEPSSSHRQQQVLHPLCHNRNSYAWQALTQYLLKTPLWSRHYKVTLPSFQITVPNQNTVTQPLLFFFQVDRILWAILAIPIRCSESNMYKCYFYTT